MTLRKNVKESGLKNAPKEHGWQKVRRNDLAISGMNAHLGAMGISDSDGKCSPIYIILYPTAEFDADFVSYQVRFISTSGYIGSLATTIRFNSADIKFADIRKVFLCLPPLGEQRAIAAFLDRETARIDTLIAKQERLIELSMEKRRALISHAVTRGLDASAPLKDSGVGWLGQVPQHWDVKRLRFLVTLNPSKQEASRLSADDLVSFLPMEAIGDDGSLDLERERPLKEVESGYTFFRDGDVTVAKITPCFENGKGALMRGLKNGLGFGTTELTVLSPRPDLAPQFLYYLTFSSVMRKLGEGHMFGSGGQKRVPEDFYRDFQTGFPPLDEQRAIVKYLDSETAKIDTLISKARRSIELMKEHRASLIAAAVTGKIDVRKHTASA